MASKVLRAALSFWLACAFVAAPVLAETTALSDSDVASVSQVIWKDWDMVEFSPLCNAFEVSFSTDARIVIKCTDARGGVTPPPFSTVVGTRVGFRLPGRATVTFAKSESNDITHIWMGCHKCIAANAPLVFAPGAFSKMLALTDLTIDKGEFAASTLQLSVSMVFKLLVLKDSLVDDLSLDLPKNLTSDLAELQLGDTRFRTLPAILYERKYSQRLKVTDLSVSAPANSVLKLSAEQYSNAVANLNTQLLAATSLIRFLDACPSTATSATEGARLVVCQDTGAKSKDDKTTAAAPSAGAAPTNAPPTSLAPATSLAAAVVAACSTAMLALLV
ncbi:hypothetical protein PINS_up014379 [Pythium insidiosum]|nr:hypothetical protein PINS_up014379 [Pythium insidiosum]